MKGHVYLIQAERSKRLKIGMADNPQKRLASLQVGSPEPLRLLHAIPMQGDWKVSRGAAKRTESKLHSRFSMFRLHGEWFNWHPAIVDAFEALQLCVDLRINPANNTLSTTQLRRLADNRKAEAK